MSGGLEVALLHELFLDHVLDVLDVDEGVVAGADALGDAAGDVGGGLRDFVDGEEGFANGDLDLGFAPRDDVAIAADQADGQGVRLGSGGDAATLFDGTAEGEGLGDVVGVVLEEGFFDQKIKVAFGKAEAGAVVEGLGERVGDAVCDVGDELAVLFGEDGFVLVLAGDEQVGEGFANGVGDVFEGEVLFFVAASDGDVGDRLAAIGVQDFAPLVGAVACFDGGGVG